MNQKSKTKEDSQEKADLDRSGNSLGESEYVYQTGGVRERSGYIPVWLILVALGLLAWAVYYTIQYWTPQ